MQLQLQLTGAPQQATQAALPQEAEGQQQPAQEKKSRKRRKADPSVGRSWTVLALELADAHVPRDHLGRFLQLTAVQGELKLRLEDILGAICKVVASSDSALSEKIQLPAIR